MNIVQEIHNEFYTAADTLLRNVQNLPNVREKSEALKSLGFIASKDIRTADLVDVQKQQASLVTYYAQRYPFNKFITSQQVEAICGKYNLVCGPVSIYMGDVPDEKLKQISAFKLRSEDRVVCIERKIWKRGPYEETEESPNLIVRLILKLFGYCPGWVIPFFTAYHWRKTTKSLMICAPMNEMEMSVSPWTRQSRILQHIPDPVVLQPVKGGYLIVAAWGDEASDENVVNEKMN